jgi:hypothetical protein
MLIALTHPTVLVIYACVMLASQKRIGRAYAMAICYIPAIIGAVLVNTLDSKNKVGLLLSYYVSSTFHFLSLILSIVDHGLSLFHCTLRRFPRMGGIEHRWTYQTYVLSGTISEQVSYMRVQV